MIRRSRVVIVICPSLEDTVRAIDPDARPVLIENAPGSGRAPDRRTMRRRIRRAYQLSPTAPVVLYTGTFEAYQGLDLLFRRDGSRSPDRAGGALLLAGGKPDQVERARKRSSRGGHRRRHDLRRRAAGGRDPRVPARLLTCSCRRVARHEHAAQDLSVSALGQADRRHAAADAHAGSERRHGNPDRRDGHANSPRGFSRRSRNKRAAAVGRHARRLAETKYSYEAYLERTRQACACCSSAHPHPDSSTQPTAPADYHGTVRDCRPAATSLRAMKDGGVSQSRSRDHYSYTVYADPATARPSTSAGSAVRSASWSRANRHDPRRASSEPIRDRSRARRRHRHRPGRAADGPGWRRVTGLDASEEMLAIARRRAADENLTVTFSARRRARARFRRSRLRRRRQPARADAHADWRESVAELCRVARSAGHHRLSVADQLRALQSLARRLTHALGARTEPYRVFSDGEPSRASSESRASASARSIASSSCRSRLHKAIGSRRFTSCPKGSSTAWACCACSARRSRSSPNGARPSHRRDGVHRRPSGARLAAPGTRSARSCASDNGPS